MAEGLLKVVCPHCKETLRLRRPATAGRHKVKCTKCEQAFAITIKDTAAQDDVTMRPSLQDSATVRPQAQTQAIPQDECPHTTIVGKQAKGVVLRLFRRHSFFKDERIDLRVGTNILGVKCDDAPSDFMFADNYMSRRSVSITVEPLAGNTFKYTFTLLRSSNPVIYNNKELAHGTSIVMRDGDSFKLGKSNFYVKSI